MYREGGVEVRLRWCAGSEGVEKEVTECDEQPEELDHRWVKEDLLRAGIASCARSGAPGKAFNMSSGRVKELTQVWSVTRGRIASKVSRAASKKVETRRT